MKNIKREDLRAMITNAIIMYDVEGSKCLKNIPHKIHENIIASNLAIDNKVSSSESGYNDLELQQYAVNECNCILTAYDRTNRPAKEARNAYLRKKYAERKQNNEKEKNQMTINIIEDMDSLIGLNLKETIEYIESKLSHCYDIVAKDNVLNERGYSCGVEYHKPFNGTLYVDLKSNSVKRMISLHFNKKTNLLEIYRITCKK